MRLEACLLAIACRLSNGKETKLHLDFEIKLQPCPAPVLQCYRSMQEPKSLWPQITQNETSQQFELCNEVLLCPVKIFPQGVINFQVKNNHSMLPTSRG